MTPRELWARCVALIRRGEFDREFDDEIATHLELAREENLRRGMDRDEARRAAAVKFGGIASAKEGVRDQRGLPGLASFFQDVGYAVRGMRRSPGFTFVVTLTLAIGIGLCSFLFSALNGLLLRPLPGAREPERLAALQGPVAYPYFESYRDLCDVVSDVAAFIGPVPFNVAIETSEEAPPERIFGHLVSHEYFSTVGTEPLLGRFFDPAFERRGVAPTVVVSERFWRTRLNADPRAIGRTLRINGQRATIVGVAQKDFLGLFPVNPADIFVPVTADATGLPELAEDVLDSAASPAFRIVLRLAPDATMGAAEAALDVRTRQLDDQYGKRDPNRDSEPRRVRLIAAGGVGPWPAEARSFLVAFYGVLMALVLSFTCANLAGLLVARGRARGREIAIRLALGAGRFRLVRQLLAESVLLAAIGGVAGLAAAYGFLHLLTRTLAGSVPFPSAVRLTPDLRVALLTFFIAAVAGVGFGLLPALAASRPDLMTALKENSAASLGRYRRFGLRNLFMVYQMASAMALVLMMGFMVIGIQQGAGRDPGFYTSGLYLFSLDPARDGYSPKESAALLAALPERLAQRSGVEGVALADPALFRLFVLPDTAVAVASAGTGSRDSVHRVALQTVGPDFFGTLGVPVLRGAEFSDRDLRSDPAPDTAQPAVINHTAAAELFGDADPLGRLVRHDQRIFQVAGVVSYGLPAPFRTEPAATVFLPFTLQDLRRTPPRGIAVVVRAQGMGFAEIGSALKTIDSRLTMFNARTMKENLAKLFRAVQYTTAIYGVVGLFALILAGVGLAGVTAHAAIRRRKEIGIRMALGAKRPQVLRLVMREGAVMSLVGSVLGSVAAYGVSRVLISMNAQFAQSIAWSGADPVRVLGAPLLLIAVAAVACYLPARRSATVDPLVSLREE